MNAETEKVLDEVKQTRNVRDKRGKLVQKAKRYLTFHEKQDREDQLSTMKRQLKQPGWVNNALSSDTGPLLSKGIKQITEDLEDNSAPTDLTAETKNVLHKRKKELIEQIRVGMLTQEEMRRNPPNAVDRHRRWEKENKDRILEYKNVCRALEPDSDAKDLASVESFRPSMGPGTFMPQAQIPGHMSYQSVPQENWDQTFGPPKVKTAFQSVEEREAREAKIALREANRKRAYAAYRARFEAFKEKNAAEKAKRKAAAEIAKQPVPKEQANEELL